MKSLARGTLAALLITFAVAAGAEEPGAWERFKNYAHGEKKAAVAEGRKLIAETDKQIAALKGEIAKSTGETKKAHQANMKELQAKKKEAQAQLAKVQKAGAGAWDATKEGFANAYKDLAQATGKAVEAVRKPQ